MSSGIAEMTGLVTKLRQDLAAALVTEWSQGQVEGLISTRKLIRWRMSGLGKFDLVRKRARRAA